MLSWCALNLKKPVCDLDQVMPRNIKKLGVEQNIHIVCGHFEVTFNAVMHTVSDIENRVSSHRNTGIFIIK